MLELARASALPMASLKLIVLVVPSLITYPDVPAAVRAAKVVKTPKSEEVT